MEVMTPFGMINGVQKYPSRHFSWNFQLARNKEAAIKDYRGKLDGEYKQIYLSLVRWGSNWEKYIILYDIIPGSSKKDHVTWKWDQSGNFSVKSTYQRFIDGGVTSEEAKLI